MITLFTCGILLCAYLCLVEFLRFRRVDSHAVRHGFHDRAQLMAMTLEEAHAILKELSELECPLSLEISYLYALFRTYGLPSMTKLLTATGQLSCPEFASKRTADTLILLQEMLFNSPASERTLQAAARINFLHDRFRKKGAIRDNDMLYTLAIFAHGQRYWMRNFEWRDLSELELCATGVYWKAVGDALNVSYDELASYQCGWNDCSHWLEELGEWSIAYENTHMKFNKANSQLANTQLEVLFEGIPALFMGPVRRFASVFMDGLLRDALDFPIAPSILYYSCHGILSLRRSVIRHLSLPRPEFLRRHRLQPLSNRDTGRYNALGFVMQPWYTKPSLFSKANNWCQRNLLGRRIESQYEREGYLINELGPTHLAGEGKSDMEEQLSILRQLRSSL